LSESKDITLTSFPKKQFALLEIEDLPVK